MKRSLVIEEGIGNFIKDNELYVLREKRSDRALNVSYTKDGLIGTVNKLGRSLYFKDAIMKLNPETGLPYFKVKGDKPLKTSDYVYVERFIPKNHWKPNGKINESSQVAELLWIDKALRLCYFVEPQDENPVVYISREDKSGAPGDIDN